ncbi:TolC family outer membrane protein [Sphingomonas solaris]|nr:TolC family outer membrane protein [Sphingomonas solaris]
MTKRTAWLTGVALAMTLSQQAGAQQAPSSQAAVPQAGALPPSSVAPVVGTETLGQAIADAYANNPRLQAQRAQLRAIDENVIQAASPYRLNLGIVSTLSYEQRSIEAFNETGRISNRNLGASLTASQILLNGGRTAAQVSAAEADVLSGRERLREVENFILLEVVDSYVSVRRDQELVAIQERSLESYRRQVEQAQARERGGDLTRTDIAQAQAQYEIIRAQLAQARASVEQSRARFAVIVGRVPGVLAQEPDLPGLPISIDDAYRIAGRDNPALWQAILNRRAGKERIAAQRAERRPQLTAEGRIGYTTIDTFDTGDLRRNIAGGVTLSVPILAQGIIGSRIRQAIADEQRLGYVVEDVRRQVDQQVLSAWNQSITAREQLLAGEAGVRAAQAALEGVRRGFAEGFRSNFEVLDSEQRLLNSQLILANARYARYAGQASLLANLGRLEGATLQEATQVYDKAAYLKRQRGRQFGPLQVPLQALDQIQKPGRDGRPFPVVPVAVDSTIRTPATPPVEGTLARAIPLGREAAVPESRTGPPRP